MSRSCLRRALWRTVHLAHTRWRPRKQYLWVYMAAVCVVAFVVYARMPETRGKILDECAGARVALAENNGGQLVGDSAVALVTILSL